MEKLSIQMKYRLVRQYSLSFCLYLYTDELFTGILVYRGYWYKSLVYSAQNRERGNE